jgi:hypothetical protein
MSFASSFARIIALSISAPTAQHARGKVCGRAWQ